MTKNMLLLAGMMLLLAACDNKEQAYDATGTFEATEVTVAAKASGTLKQFIAEEGQEINEGDIIGEIDVEQLRLKKAQLETSKAQIDANKRQLNSSKDVTRLQQLDLEKQLAVIRQQIANAQKEKQRYTELVRDGAVPRKQLDEINYQISVLEKQLAATQDQIGHTNASLTEQGQGINAQIDNLNAQREGINVQQAQIDDQIFNSSITSPITGSVLEKYVEQGEYVSTGKPLFKMADTKNIIFRAYVTSAQLKQIKVGQRVKVMTDYGKNQGETYDGVVTWISPRSEFTPKTIVTEDERADLVYAVKVAVNNDGNIKIGMYGKVKW